MLRQLVAFTLDGQGYAVPLACVERVLRMVEVTPLPKAPEVVLGVLDLGGAVLPVLSMRKRFGMPEVKTSLSDLLLVASTATRNIAVVVGSVNGVVERTTEEITEINKIVPGAQYVEGIVPLDDGLLFIHDLDRFLSLPEESQLQQLLTQAEDRG